MEVGAFEITYDPATRLGFSGEEQTTEMLRVTHRASGDYISFLRFSKLNKNLQEFLAQDTIEFDKLLENDWFLHFGSQSGYFNGYMWEGLEAFRDMALRHYLNHFKKSCECGANHTSNPKFHLGFCPMCK